MHRVRYTVGAQQEHRHADNQQAVGDDKWRTVHQKAPNTVGVLRDAAGDRTDLLFVKVAKLQKLNRPV